MLGGWLGGSSDAPATPEPCIYPELEQPTTPEELKGFADKKWQFINETLKAADWEPMAFAEAGHEDVKMFQRPTAIGFDMVMTTGTIPCSLDLAKTLFAAVDASLIKNWDPDIEKLVELNKVNDLTSVILATYSLPYPIYHRTFLTMKQRRDEAEGHVVMYASINSKDVPVDTAFVRGVVTASAYIVKPVEGKANECHLTRFVAVDPKGAIPAWVVNASKAKMGKGFVGLRSYIATKHPTGV